MDPTQRASIRLQNLSNHLSAASSSAPALETEVCDLEIVLVTVQVRFADHCLSYSPRTEYEVYILANQALLPELCAVSGFGSPGEDSVPLVVPDRGGGLSPCSLCLLWRKSDSSWCDNFVLYCEVPCEERSSPNKWFDQCMADFEAFARLGDRRGGSDWLPVVSAGGLWSKVGA